MPKRKDREIVHLQLSISGPVNIMYGRGRKRFGVFARVYNMVTFLYHCNISSISAKYLHCRKFITREPQLTWFKKG
jgi:hypothetical protein